MRVAAVGLFLSVILSIGVVAYVIADSRAEPEPVQSPEVHAPKSADERAAARVAEHYAGAVEREDKAAACTLASGAAAAELACGRDQRPGWSVCRAGKAQMGPPKGDVLDVYVIQCHVRVARLAAGWRVVEDLELPVVA